MTREEYLAYMREYNKTYKARAKWMRGSLVDIYDHTFLNIPPTEINFKGSDRDEPIVCDEFGCPNHLTPEQQLYGTKCIHCQSKQKIDVAKHISHPIKKIA